jgi:hypothetical protein
MEALRAHTDQNGEISTAYLRERVAKRLANPALASVKLGI